MTMGKRYLVSPGGGIAGLGCEDVAAREPGPGEVLVRMRAWSLNFRDLLILDGNYPLAARDRLVPLSDGAGEVLAIGPGCTRFAPGDRVCPIFMPSWTRGPMADADAASALGGAVNGVLADHVTIAETALVRAPAHMDFAEAATMPCAGVTAWNALFDSGRLVPGATVMALGTGGVAIWALQLAKAAGARVIITSSSDEKLARAAALGADAGINYAREPGWGALARAASGGEGVDLVVDSAGPATMPQSLSALRRDGELVMVGVLAPGTIDPIAILVGGARVRGLLVGSRRHFEDLVRATEVHAIHPVIDRRFGFDEAAAAFEHLRAARHMGKIVITAD